MIQELINYFENKNIAILGFGIEGKSTYKFIRSHLPNKKITIIDKQQIELEDPNVEIIQGDKYEELHAYDIIMKSPGISFKFIDITSFESKITSQLQLFLTYFKGKTIAVTGTKGKSTVSSLMYKVIEEQNKNTVLVGNIGTPIFDCLETLNEDTNVVLETSSHQLEFVTKSPNISMILNIFEEHLDHYKSYEAYAYAKYRIFKFQNESDYAIYNTDNDVVRNMVEKGIPTSKKISVSFKNQDQNNSVYIKDDHVIYKENDVETKLYDINSERSLPGDHNLCNIMFCLMVCKLLNLDIPKAVQAINTFEGLPHRMEFVGEFDGVKYYNDSIATIPEAVINGVNTLKDVNTLIIGGMDRKVDYSKFIEYLANSEIENIICMPIVGTNIGNSIQNINGKPTIHHAETMEEVVQIAKKVTKKGTTCLLSPAAASYGFFSNFQERGDEFKKWVKSS
ncbi:MAG: UDP-N-acetylmuramoyl-L-alanine--D-glutamate ligase [Oscillospiraceae bacterium]|nr:UDP-N-acetylmuramoyl-L-alanine--D-glutamate ligase [Oscillospiraceae bacterium]